MRVQMPVQEFVCCQSHIHFRKGISTVAAAHVKGPRKFQEQRFTNFSSSSVPFFTNGIPYTELHNWQEANAIRICKIHPNQKIKIPIAGISRKIISLKFIFRFFNESMNWENVPKSRWWEWWWKLWQVEPGCEKQAIQRDWNAKGIPFRR